MGKRLLALLAGPSPAGFVLRLALLLSPAAGLLVLHPLRALVEEPLTRGHAVVVSVLLTALGAENRRSGTLITSAEHGTAMEVAPSCTGFFVFWILASAVLAFPKPWRARLSALLLGALLVLAVNVVRILSLYWALAHRPELFDELHLVVWQGALIAVVSVYWYAWASRRPRQRAPAA